MFARANFVVKNAQEVHHQNSIHRDSAVVEHKWLVVEEVGELQVPDVAVGKRLSEHLDGEVLDAAVAAGLLAVRGQHGVEARKDPALIAVNRVVFQLT